MKTLICNYCKKEFQARSRSKIYCSEKCRAKKMKEEKEYKNFEHFDGITMKFK